jgi:hypothetical protein
MKRMDLFILFTSIKCVGGGSGEREGNVTRPEFHGHASPDNRLTGGSQHKENGRGQGEGRRSKRTPNDQLLGGGGMLTNHRREPVTSYTCH